MSRFRTRRKTAPAKAGEQGFTLIEVLAAVIVLGFAYVAVLQSFSLSMRSIDRLRNSRMAVVSETIALDEQIRAAADESSSVEVEEGSPYMEGNVYVLVWIENEDGTFGTLRLDRK